MSIFALIRGVFIAALMMVMSVGTVYSQSEEDEDPAQAGRLGDLSNIKDFKELSGMAGRLAPHGDDLMGDMIDKNTGGISFQHTDISIPGNSGLEVALRRKRSQGTPTFSPFQNGFGDWDIELPIAYIAYAQNVEDNGNPDPTFDDGCLRNSGPMVRDARAGSRGGSVDISSEIHTSGSILYIRGKVYRAIQVPFIRHLILNLIGGQMARQLILRADVRPWLELRMAQNINLAVIHFVKPNI